jgi:hypothetical protein
MYVYRSILARSRSMVAMENQQSILFTIVERFYVTGNSKTSLRLHVKYPIFLSYFKQNWFLYMQICIEVSNMKFVEMQPVAA